MKKKIKLGKDLNSFLIPLISGYKDGYVIYINDTLCRIKDINLITMRIEIFTNNPENYIQYEIKNL